MKYIYAFVLSCQLLKGGINSILNIKGHTLFKSLKIHLNHRSSYKCSTLEQFYKMVCQLATSVPKCTRCPVSSSPPPYIHQMPSDLCDISPPHSKPKYHLSLLGSWKFKQANIGRTCSPACLFLKPFPSAYIKRHERIREGCFNTCTHVLTPTLATKNGISQDYFKDCCRNVFF